MLSNYSDVKFSKILIVDDEIRLASKLQVIFEFEGVDARICHAPQDAIEVISTFIPDVILLDLNFGSGKRSGMETLPDILRLCPSCCVLIYTGYGDIQRAVEAMHSGAWDMIQKGMHDPSELVTIVRERYRKKIDRDELEKERNRLIATETTRETARQLASGIVHDAAHRVQEFAFHLSRIERLTSSDNLVRQTIVEARTSLSKLDDTLTLLSQFSEIPVAEIAPLEIQPVLFQAVEECNDRLIAMERKGVLIEILDTRSGLQVESNERLLRMALLALLQNAVEAQDPGRGKVIVKLEIGDGQVRILIVDNGTGLSEQDLAKLGNGCFTTKGSAGNGLGVLFAMAVAKRSNGSFRLQNNNPPPGATAIMRLPFVDSKLMKE